MLKKYKLIKKIIAVILSALMFCTSFSALFPVVANAAMTSSYNKFWGSGSGAHKHFYVNGKDAFCIDYSKRSGGTFKSTTAAKNYYNKTLGSGKQEKIEKILTYSDYKGYLNYSKNDKIGNQYKKDIYYAAVQRAIWNITNKSQSEKGLSNWYKKVTKSAFDDIIKNYFSMLSADDIPSFSTATLTPGNNYTVSIADKNKVLNSGKWKVQSYAGLKSAKISGNNLQVSSNGAFSGSKKVKLVSKYKVYDLSSGYAGVFDKQYVLMTAGGSKTLSASMNVKAQNATIPHQAAIQIKKTDNNNNSISGIKFKLTFTDQEGDKQTLIGITDSNGLANFTGLDVYKNDNENNGNPVTKIQYTLEEIASRDEYFSLPGTEKQSFTLTTGETYNAKTTGYSTWVNIHKLGDIKVLKYTERKNGGNKLGKDFEFKLTNNSTRTEYLSKTDENGEAYFCNVPVGTYTLSEINNDAYIPTESQTVEIEWDGNTSLENRDFSTDKSQYTESKSVTYEDNINGSGNSESDTTPDSSNEDEDDDLGDQSDIDDTTFDKSITGTIIISLVDSNNSPVSNAKFSVTASDNSDVTTAVTDDSGKATISNLYGGTYIVKQISTNDDLFLDTNDYSLTIGTDGDAKELKIINDISDDSEEEPVAPPTTISTNTYVVYNKFKRGDVKIVKSAEIVGSNPLNEGSYKNLAGFKFKLISSADDNVMQTDLAYTISTDSNGCATVCDIPVGKYTISEIETPEEYEQPNDIVVDIKWDGSTEYTVSGKNDYTTGNEYLSLDIVTNVSMKNTLKRVTVNGIKKDNEGETVSGAIFGIFKSTETSFVKENALALSTSDEKGLFSFSNVPFGKYIIAEISAPDGYLANSTPQYIEVNGENLNIQVSFVDTVIKGRISIYKTGEGFSTVEENNGIYKAVYKEVGLQNVYFDIYAADDIYKPNGTKAYSKGDFVESLTTDENGKAMSSLLYLGSYNIIETKTLNGYKINKKEINVPLNSQDGRAVVVKDVNVENQRQHLSVELTKSMEVDNEFNIGINNEYEDVVFGLFAANDIIAPDGSVIPSNGLISMASPNFDGYLNFDADLPYGYNYYVKEIKTNEKYILDENIYAFSFNQADQNVDSYTITINDLANNGQIENMIIRGKIIITKTDVSTGKVIPDCKVEILDSNKKVVAQGTTDKNGEVEFELPYGKYYYREYEAPNGYILDTTPHAFEITENGQIIKAKMTNDPIKVVQKVKTGIEKSTLLGVLGLIVIILILIKTIKKRKV